MSQWTVPDIVAPGGGFYYCATWIGLDGVNSEDIVQMGIVQGVFSVFGVGRPFAVWEWFPEAWVEISNFPVSPGDVVFGLICMPSTREAAFYLANETNTAYTSFRKTAPRGVTFVGDSAEWILEIPMVNGELKPLARYGYVYFDFCVAGTRNHVLRYGGKGDLLITMVDANNKPISVPRVETDQLIKLVYAG
jgi:hypothetical protein